MRRGDLYRYEPVMARAGQSTTRLIVSADAVNSTDALPTVYAMHVVDSDPGSLLAVRVGELGWAFAMEIDRPPRRRLVEHLGRAIHRRQGVGVLGAPGWTNRPSALAWITSEGQPADS